MFNNFDLNDDEILKIINDYKPFMIKTSTLKDGFDEDLMQEIKYIIYKRLRKNRKNYKK